MMKKQQPSWTKKNLNQKCQSRFREQGLLLGLLESRHKFGSKRYTLSFLDELIPVKVQIDKSLFFVIYSH